MNSFKNLVKRDKAHYEQLHVARNLENYLPAVPNITTLTSILETYVKNIIKDSVPLVSRQIQELVAIKLLDPWENFIHENAIPGEISSKSHKHLYYSILSSIKKNSNEEKQDEFSIIDIVSIIGYVSILLASIPVITIHCVVKKLPTLGVNFMLLGIFVAFLVLAVLQILNHSGKEFTSKDPSFIIEESTLYGLGNFQLLNGKELEKTTDNQEYMSIKWKTLELISVIKPKNINKNKIFFLKMSLREVSLPLKFSVNCKAKEYATHSFSDSKTQSDIYNQKLTSLKRSTTLQFKVKKEDLEIEKLDIALANDNAFTNIISFKELNQKTFESYGNLIYKNIANELEEHAYDIFRQIL